MKNLCDDIHTAILSLRSKNRRGGMFIGARQTSQGTHRAYNTTDLTDLQDPALQRHDAQDGHTMSQDRQSIYSTQRCARIMRSVSEAHSLSTTQSTYFHYLASTSSLSPTLISTHPEYLRYTSSWRPNHEKCEREW